MKKELKPKNGWRTSLIFASRKPLAESAPEAPPSSAAAPVLEEALTQLSLLRRSWYFRSPLSASVAEASEEAKPSVPKTRSGTPGKRKSRLPALSVRRSTLIDIIKSKRLSVPA